MILSLPGQASAKSKAKGPGLSMESWHATSLEAKALRGELNYQMNDMGSAKENFDQSLDASVRYDGAEGEVVAFDLYRTAELALRRGDRARARQSLEILVGRFSGSDWARKASGALARLDEAERGPSRPRKSGRPDESLRPVVLLSSIQESLRGGRDAEALKLCGRFLDRFERHDSASEIRLLEAALRLRAGDRGAASDLKALAGKGGPVSEKAAYLLAAVESQKADASAVEGMIPEPKPGRSVGEWTLRGQVWRGLSFFKAGDLAASARAYRHVLQVPGDSPAKAYALAALGRAQHRAGRPAKALELWREASVQAKAAGLSNLDGYLSLATAHGLQAAGDTGGALAAYTAFLKAHPAHPVRDEALFFYGMTLKRNGKRDKALTIFKELTNLTQTGYLSRALLQAGQIHYSRGEADKAAASYERMRKAAEPGSTEEKEALLLSAQCRYNTKRYAEAAADYRRILEAFPGDERSREVENLLLTSLWYAARDGVVDLESLEAAVQAHPRHPVTAHIRWRLGLGLLSAGRAEAAAGQYRRLIEDFPGSKYAPGARHQLGRSLLAMGKGREAAAAFRAVLENHASGPYARPSAQLLGAALALSGDSRAAAGAFRDFLGRKDAGKDREGAMFGLAEALRRASDSRSAVAAYETLLKLFPGTAHAAAARYQAGLLLEKGRRTDEAKAHYQALRAVSPAWEPHRLGGMLRLGLLWELEGKVQGALKVYTEVVKLSKDRALTVTAIERVRAIVGRKAPRSRARRDPSLAAR